jgi:hypothetical protein
MKTSGYAIKLLAGLLLYASASWGQEFGDHITGAALSCKEVSYNISGNVDTGYYIHTKKTAPLCSGLGPATAQSEAKVGPPALSSSTTAAKSNEAEASSDNVSHDTAILTPPSGWKGSVPVTLRSSYTFSVQGASETSPANFVIEWFIDSALKKSEKVEEDGHGTPNFKFAFDVLPNDIGSYEFVVQITGSSSATGFLNGGSSASFSTNLIDFVLPEGWTCTWLSTGEACQL